MSNLTINLPNTDGSVETYRLSGVPVSVPTGKPEFNRIALSAVHVVADPFSPAEPSLGSSIDWDATLAYRRYLLDLGLDIAEAMDTSQRGMNLSVEGALELIRRTVDMVGPNESDRIFSGVCTDELDLNSTLTLDNVTDAYLRQLETVQQIGGRVILMASPALSTVAQSPEDFIKVYSRVLTAADKPVILHWLGDMFDPRLAGYWGQENFDHAGATVLEIINTNASKVDGIKLSLLDDKKEIDLRRRLPSGVRMYTGDDFNYPDLIAGDEEGYSDALLGIFDAIAPAAAAALAALAKGDRETYDNLLAPTVPLSRLIFRAPTMHYKTGVVFLAWLNGFQDHFIMLGGTQSMRPLPYFTELFKLADAAGLFRDPDQACARMRQFIGLYGAA